MGRATIELPGLLVGLLGVERLEVEGATVAEALEAAYGQVPQLRALLCDEAGRLRPHVLCIHEGRDTRFGPGLAAALGERDRIGILQAVSGG